MIYYVIALVAFLIDQGTKYLVATRMEIQEQIPIIGNFFILTSHRNRGAAFGILQEKQWFFVIVTLVVVAGIVWYLQRVKNARGSARMLPIALSLVLGGALGNFLDRVRMGEVVDFFLFNFGSYSFPIFNVADSCIVVGVVLIILDTLLDARRPKEPQLAEQPEQRTED
ncbi:signal peptidase II [Saccharibacillus alkalitolerans]|uniref:Lipoprotein signal peptidase n=1 Tax=Saccharibacillus alkalitolerans TaxID=2705290 RepID=A0ABX0F084_9BACL|nr:signal peptidase II [Saccharibacillus alkalitolerans]NGZ73892.1 lipoprotein signal peptidase [Saccharibacillus alkalitolerans]